MSITVTKGEGVTVLTMKANPKSAWPPICQFLGALCYNPLLCSVSQRLRRLQATSQSVLGTIQIMVGLLNIGLGAVLIESGSYRSLWYIQGPYWLGGVYIAIGIMCILAERFPSVCLVGINVLLNAVGVAIAITGIVLYAIDLGGGYMYSYCNSNYWDNDDQWSRRRDWDYYGDRKMMTTPPSLEKIRSEKLRQEYTERCNNMRDIAVMLLRSLDVVLIVLTVLQLCVTISSVVMGIKTLKNHMKKSCEQDYNPLLKEVTTTTPAA